MFWVSFRSTCQVLPCIKALLKFGKSAFRLFRSSPKQATCQVLPCIKAFFKFDKSTFRLFRSSPKQTLYLLLTLKK